MKRTETTKRSRTLSLTLVAWLFILVGGAACWDIASDYVDGKVTLNFTAFSLIVGIGLLYGSKFSRLCALLFVWMGFLACVFFAVLLVAAPQKLRASFQGVPLEMPERFILPAIVLIVVFVSLVWVYSVLVSPGTKSLCRGGQ